MATTTLFTAPDNGSGGSSVGNPANFFAWANGISNCFRNMGWVQAADTGQVTWPVGIVSITNIAGNGTTATFTYSLTNGTPLRVGNSIVVTGATTSGFNATYIIASIPSASTFTALSSTNTTEAETTCWGGVNEQCTISNAIGNGSSNTYTYTNADGLLINGQTVVITGCTTSGFNGSFTIASINTGAGTFTTTTGISHAAEAETGTGIVACTPPNHTPSGGSTLPPATGSNVVYEMWKMGDTLQATFPVFCKFEYGTSASGNWGPLVAITVGTGSNGAGTINSGSTTGRILPINGSAGDSDSLSVFASYFSGDTNRMLGFLWPYGIQGSNTAMRGFFSIERSHNTSGADTGDYVTLLVLQGPATQAAPGIAQITVNSTTATTTESKLQALMKIGTTTGDFGPSTIISPIYPVPGTVGNPMINLLCGKSVDWLDLSLLSFTMYNTAHTYRVMNGVFVNGAGYFTYEGTGTNCLIYRWE